VSQALRINAEITIPRSELRLSFVRSSGPGGQNVNKVASKAVMRWDVAKSRSLPDDVRGRLLATVGRRINDRGELILASQRYRDQSKNVEDCRNKLRQIVLGAAAPSRPRKKTRKPKRADEARLRQKRANSERKRRRGPPSSEQ
jgi:ribosome-associated protein